MGFVQRVQYAALCSIFMTFKRYVNLLLDQLISLTVVCMATYFALYIFGVLIWRSLLASNFLPWASNFLRASNFVTASCQFLLLHIPVIIYEVTLILENHMLFSCMVYISSACLYPQYTMAIRQIPRWSQLEEVHVPDVSSSFLELPGGTTVLFPVVEVNRVPPGGAVFEKLDRCFRCFTSDMISKWNAKKNA